MGSGLKLPVIGDTAPKPEVLLFITLDEIAGRLGELQQHFSDMVADGLFETKTFTVGTEDVEVNHTFLGFSLFNDGTADIYVVNERGRNITNNDAPLVSGEKLSVDLKKKKHRVFWLKTLSGTATVRMLGYR